MFAAYWLNICYAIPSLGQSSSQIKAAHRMDVAVFSHSVQHVHPSEKRSSAVLLFDISGSMADVPQAHYLPVIGGSMESERKEQTAATAASYMQADVAETLKRCLPGMSASEAQAVVANDPTLREQHERHKRLRYTEELVGRIAAVQAEWAMPECTALQSAEQMQHDLRSAIREHAHRRCPS